MIRAGAVLLLAVDQTSAFVGTSRRHKVPSRRYGWFSLIERVSSGLGAYGFGGVGVGKATVVIADPAFCRLYVCSHARVHVRCTAALGDCSFNAHSTQQYS